MKIRILPYLEFSSSSPATVIRTVQISDLFIDKLSYTFTLFTLSFSHLSKSYPIKSHTIAFLKEKNLTFLKIPDAFSCHTHYLAHTHH